VATEGVVHDSKQYPVIDRSLSRIFSMVGVTCTQAQASSTAAIPRSLA
jgi:hypothetical protein